MARARLSVAREIQGCNSDVVVERRLPLDRELRERTRIRPRTSGEANLTSSSVCAAGGSEIEPQTSGRLPGCRPFDHNARASRRTNPANT